MSRPKRCHISVIRLAVVVVMTILLSAVPSVAIILREVAAPVAEPLLTPEADPDTALRDIAGIDPVASALDVADPVTAVRVTDV